MPFATGVLRLADCNAVGLVMKAWTVFILASVLVVFVLALLGPYIGTDVSVISSCLVSAGLSLGLGVMFGGLWRGRWH